ncbi:MAG: riboflavin biosynthesis protein RibF [Peptoniphilaceae bacterium]|nr:riboflavin biosynthesis protein RibF [Peptoniphilaceae bacterium]MDY6085539.1 riboflavin biosynthesis protein RibF [Peptoniphilaceae bacterium]
MKIIDSDHSFSAPSTGCVIALGNFDGIHLGHQRLLAKARALGDADALDVAVLLFKTHTKAVLVPEEKRYLSSTEDKLKSLEGFGVDRVYLRTFDAAFARTPKEVFLRDVLVSQLKAVHVVTGEDYTFGRDAAGTVDDLIAAQEAGLLQVHVEDYVDYEKERISSTRIRHAVADGRVEDARAMMGKPYHLVGTVGHGAHRGHHLGYATANLNLSFPYVLPGEGVYLTKSHLGGRIYYGMTSVGDNPTFTDTAGVTIETNLFDFDADIYEAPMQLDFLRFERHNVKFDTADALREQLVADERLLRAWAAEERLAEHVGF